MGESHVCDDMNVISKPALLRHSAKKEQASVLCGKRSVWLPPLYTE